MAPRPRPAPAANNDALSRFQTAWGRAEKQHDKRCRAYERSYNAYKGVLEQEDDQYENHVNPWFVFMTIELLASNLSDELTGTVRPKTATAPKDGARLLEKILNDYRDEDEFDSKQPQFIKQALIFGASPAKVSWKYETALRTSGQYSTDPGTGAPSFVPQQQQTVICDRPTFTVISPYDFLVDPAGRSLSECSYSLYRSYQSMEHLKQMEAMGVYTNIANVAESRMPMDRDTGGRFTNHGQARYGAEIVEHWTRDRLVVVANRTTVIRDEENPFWHGELPFIVATTLPDLFSVQGISEVETIIDLARALTRSLNQRLDNADLVNNGVVTYNPATTSRRELEKLVFRPKTLIPKQNQNDWQFEPTNTNIIDSALRSDESLLQLIRDIPGASSYLSGASDAGVNQNTATGISLIQSMAQKRLVAKQNQLAVAYKRKAKQEIQLIQQFTRAPKAILMDAADANSWRPYTPDSIRGEYDYAIEDAQEGVNKQQRRNEATQRLMTMMQAAQIALATGQQDHVVLRPEIEAYLDAWDVEDTQSRFAAAPPPPPMLAAPPLPGNGAGPASPGAPATGGFPPTGAAGPPPPNGRPPLPVGA